MIENEGEKGEKRMKGNDPSVAAVVVFVCKTVVVLSLLFPDVDGIFG